MACASTIKSLPGKNSGWICTGDNLVTLMTAQRDGQTIPCVVPAERVGMMMATDQASAFSPEPYDNSGDHFHLNLPQRVVVDWLDGVFREYVAEHAVYAQRGGESVLEIYGAQPVVASLPEGERLWGSSPLLAAIPLRTVREWRWEGR